MTASVYYRDKKDKILFPYVVHLKGLGLMTSYIEENAFLNRKNINWHYSYRFIYTSLLAVSNASFI